MKYTHGSFDSIAKDFCFVANAEGVETSSPVLRAFSALRWGCEVGDGTTPSGLRQIFRFSQASTLARASLG